MNTENGFSRCKVSRSAAFRLAAPMLIFAALPGEAFQRGPLGGTPVSS